MAFPTDIAFNLKMKVKSETLETGIPWRTSLQTTECGDPFLFFY